MTVRSTTSSNQPPPPFYGQHTVGVHRNTHRAADVTGYSVAICAVTVNVVLGRNVDTVLSTGSGTPIATEVATKKTIPLNLGPSGL